MGKHQQELSLAALPRLDDDSDDESINSKDSDDSDDSDDSNDSNDGDNDDSDDSSDNGDDHRPDGSPSCRCERYGITRGGDWVKLDCGGTRCGYSDDCNSNKGTDDAETESGENPAPDDSNLASLSHGSSSDTQDLGSEANFLKEDLPEGVHEKAITSKIVGTGLDTTPGDVDADVASILSNFPPAWRDEVLHDERDEALASLPPLVRVQARKDSALERERPSREPVSTEEAFLNTANVPNVMEGVEDFFAEVFKACDPSSF